MAMSLRVVVSFSWHGFETHRLLTELPENVQPAHPPERDLDGVMDYKKNRVCPEDVASDWLPAQRVFW